MTNNVTKSFSVRALILKRRLMEVVTDANTNDALHTNALAYSPFAETKQLT
jgi:hypothetical protein